MDARGMGGKAKIQPPIRFEKDKERLWKGIQEGTLSVVGTDSLTYSASFKTEPDFWECRVGINLQVADTLPLMKGEQGRIDLVHCQGTVGECRQLWSYPKKGAITLVRTLMSSSLIQRSNPWCGTNAVAQATHSGKDAGERRTGYDFPAGHLTMENGEIVGPTPAEFVEQVLSLDDYNSNEQ
jgi:hypothetical protein